MTYSETGLVDTHTDIDDLDRECPGKHTNHPRGYIAVAEWAEKKLKTHEQHRCPFCGRWSIWKRKGRL